MCQRVYWSILFDDCPVQRDVVVANTFSGMALEEDAWVNGCATTYHDDGAAGSSDEIMMMMVNNK